MDKITFTDRHIGPASYEINQMLKGMGISSLDELINETIPEKIRLKKELTLDEGVDEYLYLNEIKKISEQNKLFKTYIGRGYYNTIVPPVILRNVFENPGWYTAYTPYQAEISQGRLEALMNFQTVVADLTGLPLANSSLLDEGTAAAEAMLMFFHARTRKQVKEDVNIFLVSSKMFPQTLEVLKTRSEPLGIVIKSFDTPDIEINEKVFGAMVQYPDSTGEICDYAPFSDMLKERNIPLAVAADLLSLVLLSPPGKWGASAVFGSSQRFGVPMGYGGPHAAFFAADEKYKRQIPGRIIGISKDRNGNDAYRMALQTREQHIKREKATSNICTAQALLAVMAGFYAVYHGKEGLQIIAKRIHNHTAYLSDALQKIGFEVLNKHFFDTLTIRLPKGISSDIVKDKFLSHQINLRYDDENQIGLSLDETTNIKDIEKLINLFSEISGADNMPVATSYLQDESNMKIPGNLLRNDDYFTHKVFYSNHSETQMMRYLKSLENKDLALNRTMIPLGSCTMKLNAVSEMLPVSWPLFTDIHPFIPADQAKGYHHVIKDMENILCSITGFDGMSFMPNSGAAGEYTGLLVIRAYLKDIGQQQRNVCLIPASAHGTNPASAVMAGFNVVVVKTDESGNIDLDDLRNKAELYKDTLGALMVTYPSTHGVFEESILDVVGIIHDNGGQVYMDGANMNAQVGYTSPGFIGADVCHLNLHKTFGIPHGGGGPGVGPIGVAKHLKPFLPGHIYGHSDSEKSITAVSSAPYGSALVLLISYGYLKMLGKDGLKKSTAMAILNANYLKEALKADYPILYTGKNGRVAHEMILDCREFSKSAGIEVIDIAKRLMDYGFHAPTVAFPVHGTLMVEPTESEPLESLNRFIEAMRAIREEIRLIEQGEAERKNNVVFNAPHTAEMVISDNYDLPYKRELAAFPLEWVKENKYFPPVGKIDDAFGDRNLCTCLPLSEYAKPVIEIDTLTD